MLQAKILIVDTAERRVAERDVVRSFSTLAERGVERYDVTVEDLSAAGFRFRGAVDKDVGALIEFQLDGDRTRPAEIVWREADVYGCKFADTSAADLPTDLANEQHGPHTPYTGILGGNERIAADEKWPGWVRIGLFVMLCGLIWFGISRAMS